MSYSPEQITYMVAEAIDKDKEYKSWHVSTRHLMTLVQMVIEKEREACAQICEARSQDMTVSNHRRNDALCLAEHIRSRGIA